MYSRIFKKIQAGFLVALILTGSQVGWAREVEAAGTWTEQTGSGSRNWTAITSSSDGAKLAATDGDAYIYTSTDSGVTWSTQSDSSGSREWKKSLHPQMAQNLRLLKLFLVVDTFTPQLTLVQHGVLSLILRA